MIEKDVAHPNQNLNDFIYKNKLTEFLKKETGTVSFGYVGQTSSNMSPGERFKQHQRGKSGASLVEAILDVYRELSPGDFRFYVILSEDFLNALAKKVGLELKVVTNVAEIICINILRTANIYRCMGLNVEYGKRFGGANYDAAAAGRANLSFSPQMLADLKELFPETQHCCHNETCGNAMRLERGNFYAFCQKCSTTFRKTYIVARVVEVDGEKRVHAAEDQMPKRDAEDIRRQYFLSSVKAFNVNKNTKGKPFAPGSLIKPIQAIVERSSWKCSHPDCINRWGIDARRRLVQHQKLRWCVSNWCKSHGRGAEWKRFILDVNTLEWKEVKK